MNSNSSRSSLTGISAACILSGGLITAAIIDSHRPVVAPLASTVSPMPVRAAPPIAQDSVRQQFEEQMANQKFSPLQADESKVSYSYESVKVVRAEYSAKDDAFTVIFAPQWRSKTGKYSEDFDAVTTAPATNDGYGHYNGAANLGGSGSDARMANFTIR